MPKCKITSDRLTLGKRGDIITIADPEVVRSLVKARHVELMPDKPKRAAKKRSAD